MKELVRKQIRSFRARRGLTQEGLCERAGISVDAVSRIESGSRVPTLDTLDRIAEALGIRVADLLRSGSMPVSKHPPAVQRIVTALDREPAAVQEAAESVVKAVIKVLHQPKTKRGRRR